MCLSGCYVHFLVVGQDIGGSCGCDTLGWVGASGTNYILVMVKLIVIRSISTDIIRQRIDVQNQPNTQHY